MKRIIISLCCLGSLTACNEQPEGEPVVRTQLGDQEEVLASDEPSDAVASATPTPEPEVAESDCFAASFEGTSLTHCIADPAKHRINVTYGPGDGSEPYGSMAAYSETVDANSIAFAVNGGAFSDDMRPRGYLVASGARLSELDRTDNSESGVGFFLKPNGVFYGTGGSWRIRTTQDFFSGVRDRPNFGTQSGPMLLIGGKLGDAISENGNSRVIRNGVGLDDKGRAHFVISNDSISYGQLARYFRDEADVRTALFLDSSSSSLWDPASGRMDGGRVGPIIVVTKRTPQ